MNVGNEVLRPQIASLERDQPLLNLLGCRRALPSGCQRGPVRPCLLKRKTRDCWSGGSARL